MSDEEVDFTGAPCLDFNEQVADAVFTPDDDEPDDGDWCSADDMPDIRAGDTIHSMHRDAEIVGVAHHIAFGGWYTEQEVRLVEPESAQFRILDRPKPARLDLQPWTVAEVEIEADPDGERFVRRPPEHQGKFIVVRHDDGRWYDLEGHPLQPEPGCDTVRLLSLRVISSPPEPDDE